jgi:hypothetical protein
MNTRKLAFAFFLLAFSLPLFAQSGDTQQPAPEQGQTEQPAAPGAPTGGHFRARRQTLCWREAGLTPEMVNERWKLEDNAKTKISAVCTDSSLSADQRLAKIHEIHQETDAEIAKLIPEKELTAFKACQAEHDKQNASRDKTPHKELGPCGGVIPSNGAMSEHQH